jgi:hypothetical protein
LEGGWFQGAYRKWSGKIQYYNSTSTHAKGTKFEQSMYGRAEFFNADWADGWIYGQGTKAAGAATSFDLILHVRMRIFEIHCKAKKKRIFDHRLVSWLWGA